MGPTLKCHESKTKGRKPIMAQMVGACAGCDRSRAISNGTAAKNIRRAIHFMSNPVQIEAQRHWLSKRCLIPHASPSAPHLLRSLSFCPSTNSPHSVEDCRQAWKADKNQSLQARRVRFLIDLLSFRATDAPCRKPGSRSKNCKFATSLRDGL